MLGALGAICIWQYSMFNNKNVAVTRIHLWSCEKIGYEMVPECGLRGNPRLPKTHYITGAW